MTCLDDAKFVGPVSLFVGAEDLSVQQFTSIANFARANGITTLFIKVFQWGSVLGSANDGLWYGGLTGIDAIYQAVKAVGVNVIFYGYLWGDPGNIAGDIRDITAILNKYGDVMLDMEGNNWTDANGGGVMAKQIADTLVNLPGRVWLSYPADFANNNQVGFITEMARVTNVYLPMVYNDYLVSVYKSQLDQVNPSACIMPTLDLSQEFGTNNVLGNVKTCIANGSPAISLWYEQFAEANKTLTDQVVSAMGGNVPMPTPSPTPPPVPLVLHNGCVADLQKVYQVEWNESPTECGFFTAALLKYAGYPGHGPTGTAEQVDQQADSWFVWLDGPNTNTNFNGVTIENMHQLFAAAGNLHYWDIGAISDTSDHNQDIARIKRALDAGYPVAITTLMSSVQRPDGSFVYPNVGAYHVFTIVGYDNAGNWLCNDQDNQNDPWPNKYQAWPMFLHWASIVQLVGPDPAHPWLKTIPSGDPLDSVWTGFNAQNFIGGTWMSIGQETQAKDVWEVGVKVVQILFPAYTDSSGIVHPAGQAPADGSGIKNAWIAEYQAGRNHGYAVTPELDMVNWANLPIKVVYFSSGNRVEWDGAAHWYV